MKTKNSVSTQTMVTAALMTALVIVFQLLATFTAFFGPFSTAMALLPIVIGTALCGTKFGGWFGFVFGVVVLVSGGANFFLTFDIPGTIVTVLAKGTACGIAAGVAYKLLEKFNRYIAVIAAAAICPIVNTGVFLLGCAIFFMDSASDIAAALGSSGNGMGIFWAMAMANFLIEILSNMLLSPTVVRILNIKKKASN